MKRINKKTTGRGKTCNRGKKEKGDSEKQHLFVKTIKCLGCVSRSACFMYLADPYLRLVNSSGVGGRLHEPCSVVVVSITSLA